MPTCRCTAPASPSAALRPGAQSGRRGAGGFQRVIEGQWHVSAVDNDQHRVTTRLQIRRKISPRRGRSAIIWTVIGTYPVASLLLDETNPRFAESVESQRAAANALLADGSTKLLNLAEDIAREDAVNPTELPVLVEEDGNLVVIEGNRRLAALKLLRHPDLADDPAHEKRLKAIAEVGVGPDEMICYRAESRDAAKHWLDLRHTGENGGVGVVEWEAWQSNNFRRRRGSQADRATLFCDAVLEDFPDQPELVADIETVRRGRLTTLGRLVGDPHVRHDFGFEFEGDGVVFHFGREHLLQGFLKIFGDLASEVGVSQIKSKEQRQAYLRRSAQHLPPRSERLGRSRRPGQRNEDGHSTRPAEGTPSNAGGEGEFSDASGQRPDLSKSARRTMPRAEQVIFQGLKLRNVDLRTSRLLGQAQKVGIDGAPAVAAVLIRVIVELVVTEAVLQQGLGAVESDGLKRKIGVAILALDPEARNPIRRDKTLEAAWVRTQDESGLLVQAMHSYVHNIMANPTAGEVRELSRTFRVLLERLDHLLAGNSET